MTPNLKLGCNQRGFINLGQSPAMLVNAQADALGYMSWIFGRLGCSDASGDTLASDRDDISLIGHKSQNAGDQHRPSTLLQWEAEMIRWLHKQYARVFGYFWLPCPICGEFFGGHEVKGIRTISIRDDWGKPRIVCPKAECANEVIRMNLKKWYQRDFPYFEK